MTPELWLCSDPAAMTAASRSQRSEYARPRGLFVEEHRGLAIAQLRGPMSKYGEFDTTDSGEAARQLGVLASDTDIRRVLLIVESPGGTVRGTAELGDAVAALNAAKPVTAFADDLMASAAYWVGSQARRIVANRTAAIGSIGTYSVVYDASQLAANVGVRVHVIRAGEFKGAGTFGAEVSDEQLAEVQRFVNASNEHFLTAVAKGRKMSPQAVKQIADGRVFVGEEARKVGLVDAIGTLDSVIAAELRAVGPDVDEDRSARRSRSMPDVQALASKFETRVAELVARGVPRRKAVVAVAQRHPDEHKAFIVHTNPKADTAAIRHQIGD